MLLGVLYRRSHPHVEPTEPPAAGNTVDESHPLDNLAAAEC
jgi:hypothetical protein